MPYVGRCSICFRYSRDLTCIGHSTFLQSWYACENHGDSEIRKFLEFEKENEHLISEAMATDEMGPCPACPCDPVVRWVSETEM